MNNSKRDIKLAHDFTGLSIEKQRIIHAQKENDKYSNGYACSELIEPVPNYTKASGENVNFELQGDKAAQNNCWVILGRDRVDAPTTGYGGRGDTQSAAIYICAGMNSARPYEEVPPNRKELDANGLPKSPPTTLKNGGGTRLKTHRSFYKDASLIYLSQKTDVDRFFDLQGAKIQDAEAASNYRDNIVKTFSGLIGLSKYNVKQAAAPSAAIAIKSDNVRVIGRESIRIQIYKERAAQGQDRDKSHGISLIGGGVPERAQPMVLGYNLIGSYRHLKEALVVMSGAFRQFVQYQCMINNLIADHEHVNGPLGITDMLIPWELMIKWTTMHLDATTLQNMMTFEGRLGTFLSDYTQPGDKFILSDNVFCD